MTLQSLFIGIAYTDHAPLKSSLKTKHTSGWRACWNEMMADYGIKIKFKPGTKNANADALSRVPVATSSMASNTVSVISGSSTSPPVDNSDSITYLPSKRQTLTLKRSLNHSPIIKMHLHCQQSHLKSLI